MPMRQKLLPGYLLAFLFVWALAEQVHARAVPQAAGAPPAFEVASIKPNTTSNGVRGDCHGADSDFQANDIGVVIPRGRCVITAGRLSHFIAIAYDISIARI